MNTRILFHWAPRIFSIAFVFLLSLFALDVFSEYSGSNVIRPLLIHLIPSFLLIGAIFISWRYELAGTLVFLGFALWYVLSAGLDRPWSWYAVIAVPAAFTSLLFFVSWMQKRSDQALHSE